MNLFTKTEGDSQTEKINWWLPKGKGVGQIKIRSTGLTDTHQYINTHTRTHNWWTGSTVKYRAKEKWTKIWLRTRHWIKPFAGLVTGYVTLVITIGKSGWYNIMKPGSRLAMSSAKWKQPHNLGRERTEPRGREHSASSNTNWIVKHQKELANPSFKTHEGTEC